VAPSAMLLGSPVEFMKRSEILRRFGPRAASGVLTGQQNNLNGPIHPPNGTAALSLAHAPHGSTEGLERRLRFRELGCRAQSVSPRR